MGEEVGALLLERRRGVWARAKEGVGIGGGGGGAGAWWGRRARMRERGGREGER